MNRNNKIYAPVAIITCNRYEHFRACIESLQKNTLAMETELFIGLDYPPTPDYEDGYKKITDYLHKGIIGFKKTNIFKREYNFGVVNNINDLINRIEERYDRCICTEDDNIFLADFLEYMNYYLERYKNDDKIFSISGHVMPDTEALLKGKKYNTYIWQEYDGWGTGLWLNQYKDFLNNISKKWIEQEIRKANYIYTLKISRRKRYKMVNSLWSSSDAPIVQDTGLSFYQSLTNKYQICPCKTKVKNNGWDGSGVNCPAIQEKNEGTFDNVTNNFKSELADNSLHKLRKKQYPRNYTEEAFNFKYEIMFFLVHIFGLQNAKKILAFLKFT